MTIEFREHDIRKSFPLAGPESGTRVGHVRRDAAAGVYQYLRGEFNQLVFESKDQDLDALKRKIEQVEGAKP